MGIGLREMLHPQNDYTYILYAMDGRPFVNIATPNQGPAEKCENRINTVHVTTDYTLVRMCVYLSMMHFDQASGECGNENNAQLYSPVVLKRM